MTKIAFLFPGQGSQKPGMGLDWFDASEIARNRSQQAEAALGWSVTDLWKPENESQLATTKFTQPALYTLSAILTDALKEKGVEPALTAGHSAGEFAALYAAGAWDFETGLRVIAERARLMHELAAPGAMAAVLGMQPEDIQSICDEWTDGIVQAANFNSPKQTVITGEKAAIEAISPVLKEKGARRVVQLPVSGAFHSPLMKDAQTQFRTFLQDIEIKVPSVIWVSNNTAQQQAFASDIRDQLVKQFCEPVRWVQSMDVIFAQSETGLEVGPGEVLCGLAKQCNRDWPCNPCGTIEEFSQVT
ncbi:MAG: ACP S-malonyltransferase [Candidatus Hinthialibacter antarcticus]|nr:ACP S-malonyltransferase [Candidatus Hinthialibacter antarcticus]